MERIDWSSTFWLEMLYIQPFILDFYIKHELIFKVIKEYTLKMS